MYTDAAMTVAATNPIVLDSQGRATVYADGNYYMVVKTSAGVTVDTPDNFYYAVQATSGYDSYVAKTADYTATATDDIITVNAAGGVVTISLPTAVGIEGKRFTIVKTDSSANAVTIDPNGAQTINGSATSALSNQYDALQIVSTGANWVQSAKNLELLDQDDMSSDSATSAASQQSIKAYVDSGTVTMTNKTLTSPVLNTGVSGTAVLDENDMASDSDTQLATQQSIKAYVDNSLAAKTDTIVFRFDGTAEVGTDQVSYIFMEDKTISALDCHDATAPTGADLIYEVSLNGTSIFATTPANRPTVAAGANAGSAGAPDTTAVSAGDILTAEIAQIGSGTAGADGVLGIKVY